jgi:uncharacterized membrane protein YeaQ/YmgE (transglycosylase-associated protein family)
MFLNFLVWIIVGGIIGWLASKLMETDSQQGILLNIVVGIVGAFVGALLISPLVGTSTINQSNFSLGAMVISLLGAVILLAGINIVRRGAIR